jgi:hypothetical protein
VLQKFREFSEHDTGNQTNIERQRNAIRERVKRRRKQTHNKHTISMRKQLIEMKPKGDLDQDTDVPEMEKIEEELKMSAASSNKDRKQRNKNSGRSISSKTTSRSGSHLMESEIVSNKDNLLGSLACSEIGFNYEMSERSERQAMQFIQNVEEGMKEQVIVQEQELSLPTSSEEDSFGKNKKEEYVDTQDVLIHSENTSLDKEDLKQLLTSRDHAKNKSEFQLANKKLMEEEDDALEVSKKYMEFDDYESFEQSHIFMKSQAPITYSRESQEKENDTPMKSTLAESSMIPVNNEELPKINKNYLNSDGPSEFDSPEDQFLSEVQEPKTDPDYMPMSYQNSVRNNKLMSELIEDQYPDDSSKYFSITSNGVSLKNSELMMDFGIYEMYKESNLMSQLSVPQQSQKDLEQESNLMSELETLPNEDILMSAIQMKDSIAKDFVFVEPKTSLDKLKAKVIKNSNLVDSSLFSKREIDNSKRKSLSFESISTQVITRDDPQDFPQIMSEKQHIKPKTFKDPKHVNIEIPKNKFTKDKPTEEIGTLNYEEVNQEDQLFMSSLENQQVSNNPHLIVDMIIPEHNMNIRGNNLQDSLTTYSESQKKFLISQNPDQIKDQHLASNYNSQLGMELMDDTQMEKQQREIEAFEKLMESRLSQYEDEDQFVYKEENEEEIRFNSGDSDKD